MAKVVIAEANRVGMAVGFSLRAEGHDVSFVDPRYETRVGLGKLGIPVSPYSDMLLNGVELVFVIVPAPVKQDGPDFSFVLEATRWFGVSLGCRTTQPAIRPILIYRATSVFTAEVQRQIVAVLEETSGLQSGYHFCVATVPASPKDGREMLGDLSRQGAPFALLEVVRRINTQVLQIDEDAQGDS